MGGEVVTPVGSCPRIVDEENEFERHLRPALRTRRPRSLPHVVCGFSAQRDCVSPPSPAASVRFPPSPRISNAGAGRRRPHGLPFLNGLTASSSAARGSLEGLSPGKPTRPYRRRSVWLCSTAAATRSPSLRTESPHTAATDLRGAHSPRAATPPQTPAPTARRRTGSGQSSCSPTR